MPITKEEAKLALTQIRDELMSEETPWPRHKELVTVQNRLLGVILAGLPCEWVEIQQSIEQENDQLLADQYRVNVSDIRRESRSSAYGNHLDPNAMDERSQGRRAFDAQQERANASGSGDGEDSLSSSISENE